MRSHCHQAPPVDNCRHVNVTWTTRKWQLSPRERDVNDNCPQPDATVHGLVFKCNWPGSPLIGRRQGALGANRNAIVFMYTSRENVTLIWRRMKQYSKIRDPRFAIRTWFATVMDTIFAGEFGFFLVLLVLMYTFNVIRCDMISRYVIPKIHFSWHAKIHVYWIFDFRNQNHE